MTNSKKTILCFRVTLFLSILNGLFWGSVDMQPTLTLFISFFTGGLLGVIGVTICSLWLD